MSLAQWYADLYGPRPDSGAAPPPKVLSQRSAAGGVVRVTWSLPGLRRVTLAVPEASWLEGEHIAAGVLLSDTMALLSEPPNMKVDIAPGDDSD